MTLFWWAVGIIAAGILILGYSLLKIAGRCSRNEEAQDRARADWKGWLRENK